jgi:hypothetical protein
VTAAQCTGAASFQGGRTSEGRPLWLCSHCHRVAVWDDGWSYFGRLACKRDHEPCIEFVACSEACRVAIEASKGLRKPSGEAPKAKARRGAVDPREEETAGTSAGATSGGLSASPAALWSPRAAAMVAGLLAAGSS